MIGTILNNRYELLEKIGEGGMAEVYKARCHKLNRFDAVKILKQEYSNDPQVVEKFKREATAIANLSDNNIVNIFDVGTQGDIHYIVMEYVRGKTLKDIIVQNVRLSHERAIEIAIQIAKALDCAHRNNIIHRDIKPQNILVNEDGVVKVTDFGIAKASSSVTITNSNKVIGSAHYFSPEQAKGNFVDGRTDIYSLGIVLYEMVTGRVPFDGESPVTVALKHIQDPPIPPKQLNMNIPDSLNNLILKAIDKDPNKRYQSIRDMLMDLTKIQKDLNVEIVTHNVETQYTKVMEPINVPTSKRNVEEDDEEEDDEVRRKVSNKTKKILLFVLSCILVLVAGVVAGSSVFKPSKPTTPVVSGIKVPDVIGQTKSEAKSALEELGLKVSFIEKDSEKEAGTVIATDPEKGTEVQPNSPVTVTISKGSSKVTVPDLSNCDKDQAKVKLEAAGLELGNVTSDYSDTVPINQVISSTPTSGSEANPGDVIDIVISLGPKVQKTTVPDLSGMNLEDAKKALENSQLVLDDSVTKVETTDQSKVGQICDQNPAKGTSVDVNTKVHVSVYVEKGKVTIPNFIGETVKQIMNSQLYKSGKIIIKFNGDTTNNNKAVVVSMTDDKGNALNNGDQVYEGSTIILTVQASDDNGNNNGGNNDNNSQ